MGVQVIVLLLCLWGCFVFKEKGSIAFRNVMRKRYIIFVMILFVLQSGLRSSNVGADTGVYKTWFYETGELSWSYLFDVFELWLESDEGKDPGYELLQKLFYTFIPSYQMFLIGIAVLFFTGLGLLFYNHLKSNREILVATTLYQVLFYSFMSITGHRQTIATGLLLLSIPYILKKKYIKSLFLLAIAVTIHKSAILFLLFYFIPLFDKPKTVLFCGMALYPIISAFGVAIAQYLMFESTRMGQYSNYLNDYEGAGAYTFAAFILVLGLCLIWKSNDIIKVDDRNSQYLICIGIAITFTPFAMFNPSNMRIVQYYSIFSLLALPSFLSVLRESSSMFKNIHFYVYFLFLIFCVTARSSYYEFFWE